MGGNGALRFGEVDFQGVAEELQLCKKRQRHGNMVKEVLQW